MDEDLLIACPFLKRSAAERIISGLDQRGLLDSVRVRIITDLRPESALAGSMDLSALTEFGRRVPAFELTHLPSVHAKVYVADSKMAIVTSGNLTESGLYGNVEYGIALAETGIVKEVRSDFEGYASLGAKVSIEDVGELSSEMEELRHFSSARRNPYGASPSRVPGETASNTRPTPSSPGKRENDPRHFCRYNQISTL